MRFLKFLLVLGLSALAAAAFAIVPLFGFLYYGAVAQLLEMFGEAASWEWLDLQRPYGIVIAWVLLTLIFFVSYRLFQKFNPKPQSA